MKPRVTDPVRHRSGNPYGANGLPAPKRAHIVRLLKQGVLTCQAIGELVGASKSVVARIRAAEGITGRAQPIRGSNVGYVPKRHKEVEQLRALGPLVEQGWSLPTEAERRGWFLRLSRAGNRASA